jgi:hypothetical protein
MKCTLASLLLLSLAAAGCSSLADLSGPYASTATATRTDAPTEQAERSPFPKETDEGRF